MTLPTVQAAGNRRVDEVFDRIQARLESGLPAGAAPLTRREAEEAIAFVSQVLSDEEPSLLRAILTTVSDAEADGAR
ncbi:MAG: hypothetical protein JSS40_17510 [Proteobacteria bacterium]|nr:hypothetical protein [Pseudomonadota bacterium]MBS0480049.1 hypothetical protein [Pseudomonadota bacterium]